MAKEIQRSRDLQNLIVSEARGIQGLYAEMKSEDRLEQLLRKQRAIKSALVEFRDKK